MKDGQTDRHDES